MYECIRIDEEHLSEYGPITDNFYTLSSVGFANGDIDYERLIGTWECSSAIVEGCEYQDHSEDLYATRVTFNEDGTGVLSSIERATGKSSMPDRKLIQTEQEEPEESPDYCYYFETDEDDPTQVGVCYLTHGRLGIHFLYHYDGNSAGWYLGSFHKVAE